MRAAAKWTRFVDETIAAVEPSSIGHAPVGFSGNCARPVARRALAATNASPFVRYGVRPVSLKWQHSFKRTQLRSIGRACQFGVNLAHFIESAFEVSRKFRCVSSSNLARVRHRVAGDPAGRPGRLKIKTAGHSVEVEQFAGEIEARCDSAFHRLEIDSRRLTPPQVTNSSLFNDLPFTSSSVRARAEPSACAFARESVVQRVSRSMPAVRARVVPTDGRAGEGGASSPRDGWGSIRGAIGVASGSAPSFRSGSQLTRRMKRVVQAVQDSRAPGGEPQDGRAADAIVSDEQRAALAQLCAGTDASTSGTKRPGANRSQGTDTCNEKRDGTGGMMLCPSDLRDFARQPAEREPPVARSNRSQEISGTMEGRALSRPITNSNPASALARAPSTSFRVDKRTPAAFASLTRQSMIVCEESVTGNMRPSGSVLSRTPRSSNHATVSLGENRWSGRDKRAFTARIMLAHRARIEAGMRHVAPSATGNPHLGQELGAALDRSRLHSRDSRGHRRSRQRTLPRRRR